MKIAVSATGGSIHARVEDRFARAAYYVIVDSETMRFGLVSNPSVTSEHGAGPEAASLLHDRGVAVVVTGRVDRLSQRSASRSWRPPAGLSRKRSGRSWGLRPPRC